MKKLILTAAMCILSSSAFALQDTLTLGTDFAQDINTIKTSAEPSSAIDRQTIIPVKASGRIGRYVQVSGDVTLSANFWVRDTSEFTSITLTGWGTFRDGTGKITSNNTHITTSASMWITPNQYMSQTIRPDVYVQFYQNGRSIGSATMTGTIYLNSYLTPGFTSLGGRGTLTGSIYVEDEE